MARIERLSLVWIGPADAPEHRDTVEQLRGRVELVEAAEIGDAIAQCGASGVDPHLIVLAESRPGQFSADDVPRLSRTWPLARIWVNQGTWREGVGRSGKAIAGIDRLLWHEWPIRFEREVARFESESQPGWSLPTTASGEERLLADTEGMPSSQSATIAIVARNYDVSHWLTNALDERGYETEWFVDDSSLPSTGIAAVVFDAGAELKQALPAIDRLATAHPGLPLIVLTEFPRADEYHTARAAGAAVLAKPVRMADLLWELDREFRVRAGDPSSPLKKHRFE